MFDVSLKDGRSLRVFTTNTYFFTEYTLEKVLTIDPGIDVIICSCPYGNYTLDAKALCIDKYNIGLFKIGQFMGAIRNKGDDFLNYLLREEQYRRIECLKSQLSKASIPYDFKMYVFGSYIRRYLYKDIDLIFVYPIEIAKEKISSTIDRVYQAFEQSYMYSSSYLDIIICSQVEYQTLNLDYDNRTRII